MTAITSILQNLQKENSKSFYLSIFRVITGFILLKRLLFILPYLPEVYGPDKWMELREITILKLFGISTEILTNNYILFFIFYGVLILLFILGIGKNAVALTLFASFYLLNKWNYYVVEGGGEILMQYCLMYLSFANSYEYLSLSKWNLKTKWKKEVLNFCSNLAWISILIHLTIAYVFNGLYKAGDAQWLNGWAVYYSVYIDRFNGLGFNPWFGQFKLFLIILNYAILAFEAFFFLIFFKAFRKLMTISGVILHVGLGVFFMLYDFEFYFILCYGFFYSNQEMKSFINKALSPFTKKKVVFA